MRWIYRILRLFFCPHRLEAVASHQVWDEDATRARGVIRISRCRYCGRERTSRVMA
jgi:hypothetical protein